MKSLLLALLLGAYLFLPAQSRLMDAALAWDKDIVLFFSDNRVIAYDNASNRITSQKTLAQAFPGLTFTRIDAVLDYANGKLYFFSGGYYTRFDRATMRADAGYPRLTAQEWPNLRVGPFEAAVSWPSGKSYFFTGTQYVRYDRVRDLTDEGYPKPINEQTWPGLGFTSVDAATVMPNGKMYVFKGNQYVRYDVATDRADPGYPKSLDLWIGLREALIGTPQVMLPPPTPGPAYDRYSSFEVTTGSINLAPYTLKSPNRVVAQYMLRKGIPGQMVVGFQQQNDGIILRVDNMGRRIGPAVELKDYWISDICPLADGSMVVLAGKDVRNDYLTGYPNTLYFINISVNGMVTNTAHIFGGDGHGPGKSWFDGRTQARIAGNGQDFGIYFEVQKNWAAPGQAADIHNGDMFVAVALNGRKKEGSEHFWTASHSNTVQVDAMPGGDYWTMTIGDANPFGLQVYNRTRNTTFVAWPPKEDYVPYERCETSNAAGLLHFMDATPNGLIAIMGTLDHPNIGIYTKEDPLLLKMDTQGNILIKKYLQISPDVDESNISVHKIGPNYAVAFGPGNVYENNWQPGNFELCVIDGEGNFLLAPTPVDHPLDSDSNLVPFSDRELVWCTGTNGTQQLMWYNLVFK